MSERTFKYYVYLRSTRDVGTTETVSGQFTLAEMGMTEELWGNLSDCSQQYILDDYCRSRVWGHVSVKWSELQNGRMELE
ncbi:MAG: hypothetical protein F6K21_05640 [Symploca sp. SIO2D2]|nr:hypothetical protein [Symploca sp. SIO2D2]